MNDGGVVIGTTSPDSSAKLTLQDADFAGLYMNLSDSSGTSIVDIRGAVSGTEKFRLGKISSSSDDFSITTGGSTALTIDTSQRVGIGTTSPDTANLHVKDSGQILRLETSDATGNAYISYFDSSALKGHIGYTGSSDDDFNIFQNESANLKLFTAALDRDWETK